MELKLVAETDPILGKPTPIFDFADNKINLDDLIESMSVLMKESRGIGLAAPQVGLSLRMFIMERDEEIIACFNPEIVSTSEDLVEGPEGCLSFPDLWLDVKRPVWVEARYQNALGIFVNEKFADMEARCYAHERDHIDGIRFTKLVNSYALEKAKKKRRRQKLKV